MNIDDILASVSNNERIPQRASDLQALTRAWVAERCAPELLPYPEELVDRVMERIKTQIETVEDMTGTMDPSANFNLIIIQTELERFKFLIRSFLRARIAKLDKYPHHHLPSAHLSATESQYLTHRCTLLTHHFSTSFLSSFPAQLQKLDDRAGGISMVDAPDVDAAVFVRVLRDAGHVEVQGEGGVGVVELRRGDVWCVRWSAVREACLRGDVEMV
ncbi:DNA replication complex GINS protein SLD5 [Aureobasidium namibiae CBS 147.97]|uniref:DNA replication complex GINS protein SLD5 n=1 Tax=Aureobasidium namibiae CBS 147.97 TaxID=1043004 RepID=A0A074WKA9_9PEZI|nr:DNA replication complex GINS protein SLD5 [Aureobasidium namibiae CBS 147.97]KEQ72044.1 DNA replication complex GINS protein SLD5 [Aureobasidium namibiae CBS 147.97]